MPGRYPVTVRGWAGHSCGRILFVAADLLLYRKRITMKPGMGTLLWGIALLVIGGAITAAGARIMIGALVFGVVNIVRGCIQLSQNEA
jgi:hypothetical protein